MDDAMPLLANIHSRENSVDSQEEHHDSNNKEESDDDFSTVQSSEKVFNDDEQADATSDMDRPLFSKRDLEQIFKYSQGLISGRSNSITKRKGQKSLVDGQLEKQQVSSPLLPMANRERGYNSLAVSRKEYCKVTTDNIKLLRDNQFSLSNTNVNEKLDVLYDVLAETGLLQIVNGTRIVPIPTDSNILGYIRAHIIHRKPLSFANYSVNTFIDDKSPFDKHTHTQIIAVGADDIMRYNADLLQLLKVIKAVFDSSLQIWAQVFLKTGNYVDAFHSLITKVHGTQQSDRKTARDALDKYTRLDSTVEIGISLAQLSILQSAVEYATKIPLTEDEKHTKLNSLIFVDERIVMHTTLIDCIAKEYSYDKTITRLIHVMKLLPIESQTTFSRINSDIEDSI